MGVADAKHGGEEGLLAARAQRAAARLPLTASSAADGHGQLDGGVLGPGGSRRRQEGCAVTGEAGHPERKRRASEGMGGLGAGPSRPARITAAEQVRLRLASEYGGHGSGVATPRDDARLSQTTQDVLGQRASPKTGIEPLGGSNSLHGVPLTSYAQLCRGNIEEI
jgi:hypothetical protein